VLVILVFLLSVRATLVTAISIPTSVLITFIGLQGVGYSLNILTLGALTIAIGRVVDDSIVVIENIKRHLVPGVDRAETIVAAVREVAGAITASTITTVTVFLPISFVGGSTGELFRPFALTVTIALLASLLVSLTIVPVLAYWFLRAPSPMPARAPKPAKPVKRAKLAKPAKPAKRAKGAEDEQPVASPETAAVLVTADAATLAPVLSTGPSALAPESAPATTIAAATATTPVGEAAAAPVSAESDHARADFGSGLPKSARRRLPLSPRLRLRRPWPAQTPRRPRRPAGPGTGHPPPSPRLPWSRAGCSAGTCRSSGGRSGTPSSPCCSPCLCSPARSRSFRS